MTKHTVSDAYTIKEVMEHFDENHDRVAMVINNDGKLIGAVSQGDIIRALVAGINIYTNIQKIMQPSFLYLKKKDMQAAYRLFRERKITLIPIVDKQFFLIDTINLDDIYDYLEQN